MSLNKNEVMGTQMDQRLYNLSDKLSDSSTVAVVQSNDVSPETADPAWLELSLDFPEEADALSGEDSPSDVAKRQKLLPYAANTEEYFQPEGTLKFRLRPEWWPLSTEYDPSLFEHGDTILHAAIRENATDAALALIEIAFDSVPQVSHNETCEALTPKIRSHDYSSILTAGNLKGITPLILASKEGNISVVQALMQHPLVVDPAAATPEGNTALIEAARLGHLEIMELLLRSGVPLEPLVEATVEDGTTSLMFAAQGGHPHAVECLLRHRAAVNHENRLQMTALMFAAHRGHETICKQLLRARANPDHVALWSATALTLACQRGHVAIVKMLAAAGCSLHLPSGYGRLSPRARLEQILRWPWRHDGDDEAVSLSNEKRQALRQLLDSVVQVNLMQQNMRVERSWELIRMHALLQGRRAQVHAPRVYASEEVHAIRLPAAKNTLFDLETMIKLFNRPSRAMPPTRMPNPSTEALIRTMTLPEPLVQKIALFLPLPKLWDIRLNMSRSTAFWNANEAIFNALDLMDEVLEDGGFLTACDVAQVPAPMPHSSWADWKSSASPTEAGPPPIQDPAHPKIREMRWKVGYLSIIEQYQIHSNLFDVLKAPPYRMPSELLQELIRIADFASIARRCGDLENGTVFYESHVAMDIIQLASWLCAWFSTDRHGD